MNDNIWRRDSCLDITLYISLVDSLIESSWCPSLKKGVCIPNDIASQKSSPYQPNFENACILEKYSSRKGSVNVPLLFNMMPVADTDSWSQVDIDKWL